MAVLMIFYSVKKYIKKSVITRLPLFIYTVNLDYKKPGSAAARQPRLSLKFKSVWIP